MILPDVLGAGMYAVFCGTAVGNKSAREQAYYADVRNRFWAVLHVTGLTPVRIKPANYRLISRYGLGLTDLNKLGSGPDRSHVPETFDATRLLEKIRSHAPHIVAFNGKKAAQIVLDQPHVDFGLQGAVIHGAAVWVLPSTSGAAVGAWDSTHWFALADAVNTLRRRDN